MRATQMPGLFIVTDPIKGRCVHTGEEINVGDLIEVCPVIVFSEDDLKSIHNTHLHDYYFLWGAERKEGAIALGFGSLYNHSDDPNASFEIDLESDEIRFVCIQKIVPGSEVSISYVDSQFREDVKLWF
ncbi:MAG: SET domain-containing protein-lysine N-methyltransferase [Saprospiraceae bacterium]|nr:SET domain-containing protein-lysine N-methyltransferase [Saprospiraceae bacterium]|tara:strand:+ start:985 stop:1371 length:387 start_codon:yes stop_codon:yes gene_type:complete